MVPPTITVVKDLAAKILSNHHLYLSSVENPQEESKEIADEITQTIKILKAAINGKNEKSAIEVTEIESAREGMLAQLRYMRQSSSVKNDYIAATEEMVGKMQEDIDKLLSK